MSDHEVRGGALVASKAKESRVASPTYDGRAFFRSAKERKAQSELHASYFKEFRGVTRRDYERFSSSERERFEKARRSLMAASGVVHTHAIETALEKVHYLLDLVEASPRDQMGGLMVLGRAGVGKTTVLTELMYAVADRLFEQAYGKDTAWWQYEPERLQREYVNHAGDVAHTRFLPVLPTTFPADMSDMSMADMFLESLRNTLGGDPLKDARARGIEPTEVLLERADMHGMKFLFLDEAHFVTDDKAGRTMVNQIKWLMDASSLIIVMAGVTDAGGRGLAVFEGRDRESTKAQLRSRFEVVTMAPYGSSEGDVSTSEDSEKEWRKLVAMLGSRFILLDQDPAFWRSKQTAKYLRERSQGVLESLVRLLRRAGMKAAGGSEEITIEFLEGVPASAEADERAAEEYGMGPAARKNRSLRKATGSQRAARKVADTLLNPGAGDDS